MMPQMIRRLQYLLILLILGVVLATVPIVLATPSAQGSGPVVIVNTAYLNQRTGPGPQYVVQGVHSGGARLPVIGRTADRSWWEVDTQYGAGWVSNAYVLTQGDFRDVPVVTEYGPLDRPKAIVYGLPIPVYALPNPGSTVLGLAPSEAQYPIVGRAYHRGTDTWFWLVETEGGTAWVADDDVAIYGYMIDIPTIAAEDAFGLATATISISGIINPPPATPVPSAPVAEITPAPTEATSAASTSPTPAAGETGSDTSGGEAAPPQLYRLNIAGDCYALPLVNYLLQISPVTATRLDCPGSIGGRDLVLIDRADIAMAVDVGCGAAAETPIATLYGGDGSVHTLSFCTATPPNAAAQSFINWIYSPAGAAAIRTYQGLPGSSIPEQAEPSGG